MNHKIVKGIERFIFKMVITSVDSNGTNASSAGIVEVDPETGLATFEDVAYGQTVSIREIEVEEG